VDTGAPCPLGPCSFDGVYQPDLAAGDLVLRTSFYEISAFVFTAAFLGLDEGAPLGAMDAAGRAFCALSWAEAEAAHPGTPEDFLAGYCFSAMYFVTLLQRGYGLDAVPHPRRRPPSTAVDSGRAPGRRR
jgi:hypothetical protein